MWFVHLFLEVCGVFFLVYVSGVFVAYGLVKGGAIAGWTTKRGWELEDEAICRADALRTWISVGGIIYDARKYEERLYFRLFVPPWIKNRV